MDDAEPTVVVGRLLAAAGDRAYEPALAEFERSGEAGCDALFAAWGRSDVPIGADGAHPRDVVEDLWQTLVVAARRWPDRFLRHVEADPGRCDSIAVLSALGEIDRPAARAWLVAAARERRAGRALSREYALKALLRLGDPAVPDLLVGLVRDRSPAVRAAAVTAAVGHGDARLLPGLHHIAAAAGTPPGVRRQAEDAVAAIGRRAGGGAAPEAPG